MNAPLKPTVAAQVAHLPTLPIKKLWELWDRCFPRRPQHPNRSYLESRIAYKIQDEAYGGLSAATKALRRPLGQRLRHCEETYSLRREAIARDLRTGVHSMQ